MEKRGPAPYSTTDKPETLAIDIFKMLVDHEKVKVDVKDRDKYPNIDGYVELVDEYRKPMGKLEVQIKKLANNSRKPKLQCPISLFYYSEKTCNPVLLVGVDIEQEKAYWVHIDKNLIPRYVNATDQKSKVVTFPTSNMVDRKHTEYITKWKNIVETYQMKIQEYDKVKDLLDKLSERSNPTLGITKEDFLEMHVFLDELNNLLDGIFKIVKKRFYPYAWKIGLAYHEYAEEVFSYVLYPIPLNRNDVQIKEINKKLLAQLVDQGLAFTKHCNQNPIKSRPKEYAIEIVKSKTMKILESRLLNHKGNEFLAREFVFAFVDEFLEQLGLDKKDKYSIIEIEKAFIQYLPIWVDEAVRFMVSVKRNGVEKPADCLYRRPYFDPRILIVQIMDEERKRIDQTVRTRIKQKDRIPILRIGNDKFPFGIFVEFISYLKSQDIKEIERAYSPKDYSRLKVWNWVWNAFSPEAVERNLEVFFKNLPKVYSNIVLQNFPEIKEKMPLYGGASRVIIVFRVKEEYKSYQDRPGIRIFYSIDKTRDGLEIEVYQESETEEMQKLLNAKFGESVDFRGGKYEPMGFMSLDFIYDDLPIFNFIYSILEDNLKNYDFS